jgi:nucleotidyltransferase/DNA polymerase involved in DNA repair
MSNLRARFWNERNSDWIEISIVGDTNTVVRKVQDKDIENFPKEYEAFKGKKKPAKVEGTPLTDVKGIGESLSKKLIANGIRTAEELAETPDGALPKAVGMGAFEIRKEAQRMLEGVREEAINGMIAA